MSAKMYTLRCPNCDGKLMATPDPNRYVCPFCGTEQIIEHPAPAAPQPPSGSAADRTASELAIHRLRDDIDRLERELTRIDLDSVAQGNLSARPASGSSRVIMIVLGVLAFMFLCMTFFVLVPTKSETAEDVQNKPYALLFCGLPGAIFLVGAFMINRNMRKAKQALAQGNASIAGQTTIRANELRALIEQKRLELAQHERIVGSP